MARFIAETATHVHHWNDWLFFFRTSRRQSLRFENGHFIMVGLEVEGKPLMRAYSVASANYEPELEFFHIKVKEGPLTSRLQNSQMSDPIILSTNPQVLSWLATCYRGNISTCSPQARDWKHCPGTFAAPSDPEDICATGVQCTAPSTAALFTVTHQGNPARE